MDKAQKALKRAYLKYIKLIARQDDIIDRARDRKYYYKAKLKSIAEILGNCLPGQLSFSDHGVQNVETSKKVQVEAVSWEIQQRESNKREGFSVGSGQSSQKRR